MNNVIYESNWTEMNIEYKKFVLLNMNMNSACQIKLGVTTTKVVNLEMFLKVCFFLLLRMYIYINLY